MRFWSVFALVFGIFTVVAPAKATPNYDGQLELRMPVWTSNHDWAHSPNGATLVGDLRLNGVLPFHGILWTSGEQGLRRTSPGIYDNYIKVGVKFPLWNSPFLLNTYWDRRTSFNTDRFFVGLDYKFGGTF